MPSSTAEIPAIQRAPLRTALANEPRGRSASATGARTTAPSAMIAMPISEMVSSIAATICHRPLRRGIS